MSEVVLGTSGAPKPSGPGGEYCRVCRAAAAEADRQERVALAAGQNPRRVGQTDVRVAISSQNVLGRSTKGGDLDVVAVPYVFRYLCAELASMGIAVSLEVR